MRDNCVNMIGDVAVLNDAKTGVQVKDVMSSPVKTVLEHDSVEQAAKKMIANDLGSIIVTDVQGNPVGIITERDIVDRVVAENRMPRRVKAEATMSRPVRITTPEADIKEAAESMRDHNIRRLVVMEGGKMIGIVSSKDIVEITPALLEMISEKTRITHQQLLSSRRVFTSTGYCDHCRQWSDTLMEVNGNFLCEECQVDLESE
ncbi:MAG: CBS domain-containing protein [Candidatus Bathyarchaeota archaeon]|nr:CBS domain-containing protein [Candidatus Bathyarchaeota archaeon]